MLDLSTYFPEVQEMYKSLKKTNKQKQKQSVQLWWNFFIFIKNLLPIINK